jgi:hypothetical protein
MLHGPLSTVSFSISSSALYHASNHASFARILSGLLSNGTTEAVPKLPNACGELQGKSASLLPVSSSARFGAESPGNSPR